MAAVKKFSILLSLFLIVGCSSTRCRQQPDPNFFENKTKDLPDFQKQKASKTGLGEGSTVWVKVYKPDGSKQCGMGAAVSPEDMSKELRDKGIKIKSMKKQSDGLMRIQVCGAPTGMINVFEIQKSNADTAEQVGYKQLQ
jgi:hypothetical protein